MLKPDPALIDSMAMRHRHDFGLLDEEMKDSIRRSMTQLWEEVVGLGFYRGPAAVIPEPSVIQVRRVELSDEQRYGLRVKNEVRIPGANPSLRPSVFDLARQSGATDAKGGRAESQFCFTSNELEDFAARLGKHLTN